MCGCLNVGGGGQLAIQVVYDVMRLLIQGLVVTDVMSRTLVRQRCIGLRVLEMDPVALSPTVGNSESILSVEDIIINVNLLLAFLFCMVIEVMSINLVLVVARTTNFTETIANIFCHLFTIQIHYFQKFKINLYLKKFKFCNKVLI